MSIILLRRPSDTPTVTAHDDTRAFRHAFNDYSGIVKGYLNECSAVVQGLTLKVNSGEVVVDGVQAEIDANGISINIDQLSTLRYYTAYIEFNFSNPTTPTVSLKASYSTSSYPVVEKGDDLTSNPTGTANLPLYRFTAQNSSLSNIERVASLIVPGQAKQAENSTRFSNRTLENSLSDDDQKVPTSHAVYNKFSSDEKSDFGNYVVEKKKLLWKGSQNVGTTAVNIYSEGDDATNSFWGRTFEIHFAFSPASPTYIRRFYYRPNYRWGVQQTLGICMVPSGTTPDSQMYTLELVQVGSNYYNNMYVRGYQKNASKDVIATVFAVYEIITSADIT